MSALQQSFGFGAESACPVWVVPGDNPSIKRASTAAQSSFVPMAACLSVVQHEAISCFDSGAGVLHCPACPDLSADFWTSHATDGVLPGSPIAKSEALLSLDAESAQ